MRKHVSRGVKRGTPDSVMDVDIVAFCLALSVLLLATLLPISVAFLYQRLSPTACAFFFFLFDYILPPLLASFTDSLKLKHSPECA